MRRRASLAAAAFVAAFLAAQPAADASHIYWTNSGTNTIGRAQTDGSGVKQDFITGASGPHGIAADPSHVYWANELADEIGRGNVNGRGLPQQDFVAADQPEGVAVYANHIYWATCDVGPAFPQDSPLDIGRANLDGSNPHQDFIAFFFPDSYACPNGVAVAGGLVYWSGQNLLCPGGPGAIGRAKLDGSDADPCFLDGLGSGTGGVAADATHIYWTQDGQIGRAKLDGTGVKQDFITGENGPLGIAVDPEYPLHPGHLYWTNSGDGTIGRAALDGTGVKQDFITGASSPVGVAVDPPNPSFRINCKCNVIHLPPEGSGVLPVVVHGPGTLVLTSPALKRVSRTIRETGKGAGRGHAVEELPVRPKLRTKRRLRSRGSVKVRIHVTYRPLGGLPRTKTRRIELVDPG